MKAVIVTVVLALAAAGCGGSEPVSDDANNTAGLNAVVEEANETAEAVHDQANAEEAINEADDAGSELPSPPNTPEARMIPGQYRGRWGMVAADCDRNRSDAKGAITIGERSVVFYESTAILKERRPAIATSFSGLFSFTGEGQRWEKVMTFTRTGDRLLRAEEDGRYTYRRCA